ncbi:MAG: RNA polymerase sigma factor [Leptospiraceae bacterium]|nr:RNA polymerase sigma factor [Leptospiraceae bacterium]
MSLEAMSPALSDPDFDKQLRETKEVVYRYLLKRTRDPDLAQDLAQDALLRAHKFRQKYDTDKGAFHAWLFRIAHNVHLTWIQKQQRQGDQSSLDNEQENYIAADEPDISETVEQKILYQSIKKAIACLPEPERTVIYNKEIKGQKLADTARELDVSIRTVSRRLLSGYDILRKALLEQGIAPEGFVES